MDFDKKVVLVTGAAGTIGQGIAEEFYKQGASVFITDLGSDNLKRIHDGLSPEGKRCSYLAADITHYPQVKEVVKNCLNLYNRIDILVNVAGVVAQKAVEEIEEEEWDIMFDVNCKGTFFFIKEIVPLMKKQKFGRIINFSSKSGKTGSALMSHYSAAKAAIIGLTQSLAYELADFGINVNCICPGITESTGVWDKVSSGYTQNLDLAYNEVVKKFTAKVPLKRLAKIEDIVAITTFLASDGASYMTGQAINITGGREMH
jgi:sorbitol-6-phosphate 2-dehydrogenase